MDSLTHIILGATVGELLLGKKIGSKAALWGALVALIPDIDMLFSLFLNDFRSLVILNGPTHSVLFYLLLSPLLGWVIHRIYKGQAGSLKSWGWLVFWALLTHALYDSLTFEGAQLFFPMSEHRIALNIIYPLDPLYILPLFICLLLSLSRAKAAKWRKWWNTIGLILSSFYLILAFTNKAVVNAVFTNSLFIKGKSIQRLKTYPTPFNNVLWYAIGEEPNGFNIGYYSLLEDPHHIDFEYLPKDHLLLRDYKGQNMINGLDSFSDGLYTIDTENDTIYWNDLRSGLNNGWESGANEIEINARYMMILEDSSFTNIQRRQSPQSVKTRIVPSLINRIFSRSIPK